MFDKFGFLKRSAENKVMQLEVEVSDLQGEVSNLVKQHFLIREVDAVLRKRTILF